MGVGGGGQESVRVSGSGGELKELDATRGGGTTEMQRCQESQCTVCAEQSLRLSSSTLEDAPSLRPSKGV